MSDSLFCGWYRPSPVPRRRRKPWLRVAGPGPHADVWEAVRAHAARLGGGDTTVCPEGVDPNREGKRHAR